MTVESDCGLPNSMGVEEAAKYLDVPLLAIGQLMFEGRFNPSDGFRFRREQLDRLKQVDLSGYR